MGGHERGFPKSYAKRKSEENEAVAQTHVAPESDPEPRNRAFLVAKRDFLIKMNGKVSAHSS